MKHQPTRSAFHACRRRRVMPGYRHYSSLSLVRAHVWPGLESILGTQACRGSRRGVRVILSTPTGPIMTTRSSPTRPTADDHAEFVEMGIARSARTLCWNTRRQTALNTASALTRTAPGAYEVELIGPRSRPSRAGRTGQSRPCEGRPHRRRPGEVAAAGLPHHGRRLAAAEIWLPMVDAHFNMAARLRLPTMRRPARIDGAGLAASRPRGADRGVGDGWKIRARVMRDRATTVSSARSRTRPDGRHTGDSITVARR